MAEKILKWLKILIITILMGIILVIVLEEASITDFVEDRESVCEYSKVAEIVSAHYRDVLVRLENGTLVEINQPRPEIKVGSSIAIKCTWVPVSKIIKQ